MMDGLFYQDTINLNSSYPGNVAILCTRMMFCVFQYTGDISVSDSWTILFYQDTIRLNTSNSGNVAALCIMDRYGKQMIIKPDTSPFMIHLCACLKCELLWVYLAPFKRALPCGLMYVQNKPMLLT